MGGTHQMKVFLDTNVLVDYLNKREPFFEDAASIIGICLSGQAKGVLSALSVVNAAYIMRKAYTKNSPDDQNGMVGNSL